MKKFLSTSIIAAILLSSISCGGGLPNILTGTDGNGTGTNNGAVDIITGVLGALTNQTSASSIVGTWTYTEPAVQFESDNLLSQIGSSALNKKAESTITKYYEKIGVKKGSFSITFNQDKTCSYVLKGKTFNGTYEFDSNTNKISIKSEGFLSLPSAFARVSGNSLELTFDTTALLNMAQSTASASGNSTLGALSSLSTTFKGMKTGFHFTK